MTALASLKAELADMRKSIAGLLGSKKIKAEATEPEKEEGAEGETEDTEEGAESETVVEVETEDEDETEEAPTEEEKKEAEAALKTLKGFSAKLDASVSKIKAELKTENAKNFASEVTKAAAAQLLRASGKPLAKSTDNPDGKTVTALTGAARVKASLAAKRAK
jgi:hypothetical protein